MSPSSLRSIIFFKTSLRNRPQHTSSTKKNPSGPSLLMPFLVMNQIDYLLHLCPGGLIALWRYYTSQGLHHFSGGGGEIQLLLLETRLEFGTLIYKRKGISFFDFDFSARIPEYVVIRSGFRPNLNYGLALEYQDLVHINGLVLGFSLDQFFFRCMLFINQN